MARQILPIAGQIIGGMVGGPMGAAIGGAIGSAVGAYVDPIRHQGPKLGEARAQTAQEGVYRPLVFGTGAVAGNVIHRSPRKVVRHRESVGKGGRDTVDSDRGYRTFAIRIAEAHNPDGYQLLRIWENETLVYDVRPESEIPDESVEYAEKFRFYAGTQDQLPDPDLEAYLGVGNVNSYRGSCYIVFGNFDLTDYGDMVPQYRFEITSSPIGGDITMAISVGEINNPARRPAITRSADGESWQVSTDNVTGLSATSICAVGDRFYMWALGGVYYTTGMGGYPVGPVTSMSGVGGRHLAYTRTDTIAIPDGSILRVSRGHGPFFSVSTGVDLLSTLGPTAINSSTASVYYQRLNGAGVCAASPSYTLSGWSEGDEIPIYPYGDIAFTCSDNIFALGGRDQSVVKPAIATSPDGRASWSPLTLAGSSGSYVSMITPGSGQSWVAIIDNGEIWHTNDNWTTANKSPDTINDPTGLTFNGRVFIASGGSAGGGGLY